MPRALSLMKLCEWLMFGPINAFASSTRSIHGHKRGHRFIESIRRIVSYLLDSFEIVGQKKDSLKQFFAVFPKRMSTIIKHLALAQKCVKNAKQFV